MFSENFLPESYSAYEHGAGLLAFPATCLLPVPFGLGTVDVLASGTDCVQSGITVAGTAPDFHGVPFSLL